MRRAWLWLLLAIAPAESVRALGFYFEGVPTTSSGICPAPCYQVRMFIEDPTRTSEIQAIQLDVDVIDGAIPAVLPVPPGTNTNAAGGNTLVEDAEGYGSYVPWDLSSTVGASPVAGMDVLVVNAAAARFSVRSLKAVRDASVLCTPSAVCAAQLDGLAFNRIYLARFNVTRAAPVNSPVHHHGPGGDPAPAGGYFTVRFGGITGHGPAAEWLSQLNGWSMSFPYVPEPSIPALVACALAALGAARCRG